MYLYLYASIYTASIRIIRRDGGRNLTADGGAGKRRRRGERVNRDCRGRIKVISINKGLEKKKTRNTKKPYVERGVEKSGKLVHVQSER